jgi:ribose/xylose/arabinose/galactoside ABC-type transport system permease subunit
MRSKEGQAQLKDAVYRVVLRNKVAVSVIFLGLILNFVTPLFLTSTNLFNVLRQITTTAILSVGFTLVLGAREIDLSVGALLGLVGVILAKLLVAGVPIWLAIAIGLAFGTVCGMAGGIIITLFEIPAFIVTLATAQVYRGANYLITGMAPVTKLSESFAFIGQGYLGPIPIPVCILAVVFVIVVVVVNKTLFGRHAIAVGGNIEAARLCGIKVMRVRVGVYAVAALCASIGAVVMTARAASAQIGAGQGMEMDAITAVVIGGTPLYGGNANVIGTLFGCMIVGMVNNGLNLLGIDSNWQVVAKGLLILFAVLSDVLTTRFYENVRRRQTLAE